MIDGKEQHLNAVNLTDCAEKLIPDDAVYGLITNACNNIDSTDFFDDNAGGLIAAINSGNSTDCADILI